MLLAIDTSAGTAVAVVGDDGRTLGEVGHLDRRRHAEMVGFLIAAAMKQAEITPVDITAVAVGMGPGPFTGLRVGIAAARAFAFGIGRPLLPVASHDAVAYGAALDGHTGPLLVVTDARRREVAWSRYDAPGEDGLPRRAAGPELAPAEGFAPEGEVAGGDGAPGLRRIDAEWISAAPIGLLAHALAARGQVTGPRDPLYLRDPDVTLSPPKRVS